MSRRASATRTAPPRPEAAARRRKLVLTHHDAKAQIEKPPCPVRPSWRRTGLQDMPSEKAPSGTGSKQATIGGRRTTNSAVAGKGSDPCRRIRVSRDATGIATRRAPRTAVKECGARRPVRQCQTATHLHAKFVLTAHFGLHWKNAAGQIAARKIHLMREVSRHARRPTGQTQKHA